LIQLKRINHCIVLTIILYEYRDDYLTVFLLGNHGSNEI